MSTVEAIAILRIALDLAERMAAIAKRDPAAWEAVKADYNNAVEEFKNGNQAPRV